jgi:hypothetical protein
VRDEDLESRAGWLVSHPLPLPRNLTVPEQHLACDDHHEMTVLGFAGEPAHSAAANIGPV